MAVADAVGSLFAKGDDPKQIIVVEPTKPPDFTPKIDQYRSSSNLDECAISAVDHFKKAGKLFCSADAMPVSQIYPNSIVYSHTLTLVEDPSVLEISLSESELDCDPVDLNMMRKIYPPDKVSDSFLSDIASELGSNLEAGQLNSEYRLAHFFAQVMKETGSTMRVSENLNYSETALTSIFGYFKKDLEETTIENLAETTIDKRESEASLYGRNNDHAANWEAIADRAYANRIGNGDVESGDGWLYRGRGMKQLTGRENYQMFTKQHQKIWKEDIDFEEDPDLLLESKYAVRSAIVYWVNHGLAEKADEGVSKNETDSITAVVNKNTKSYDARHKNLEKIMNGKVFSNVCY